MGETRDNAGSKLNPFTLSVLRDAHPVRAPQHERGFCIEVKDFAVTVPPEEVAQATISKGIFN